MVCWFIYNSHYEFTSAFVPQLLKLLPPCGLAPLFLQPYAPASSPTKKVKFKVALGFTGDNTGQRVTPIAEKEPTLFILNSAYHLPLLTPILFKAVFQSPLPEAVIAVFPSP
jgi:hypothetical protein